MHTGLLRKKSRHSAGFFSYLLLVPTPRRAGPGGLWALNHPGTLMRATPPLDEELRARRELGMFMSWGVGGGDFQAFLW